MRPAITIIAALILTLTSFGQLPKKVIKGIGQNPIIFVDSVEVSFDSAKTLNPFDISDISIVKPKKAKKLLSDKGSDGAIYVTTVKAAKKAYWTFFSAKSDAYKQLVISPQADTIVQYILNGQPLSDSAAPGKLFLITDKNFKAIEVIDKEMLPSASVSPKRYVVAVRAKYPKGLVKASIAK